MSGGGKIRPRHLERLPVVYVRQSSLRQVRENRESTERQYALRDHALSLGLGTPDRVQRPAPHMRGISPDDRY